MLISCLFAISAATAYDLNDRYWDHIYPSEEPFELNVSSFPDELVSDERLTQHFQLALDIWNTQGDARIHLDNGGTTTDVQYGDGNNDHNTTLFQELYEGTALAKARYNAIDNALTDCDIAFYGENLNGVIPWSFAPDGGIDETYDFAHTMVHEMGHCVGISHSEFEEAVMYGSSTKGSGWEKRDLHTDDIAAIQAIYGTATIALTLDQWHLNDATGDGVMSPGETGEIVVTVRNAGDAHAYAVDGRLVSPHPAVIVQDSTHVAVLGDLAPGSTLGTHNPDMRFAIRTPEDCLPTGPVELNLQVFDHRLTSTSMTIDIPVACALTYATGTRSEGCGCNQPDRFSSNASLLGLLVALGYRRKLLQQS